MWPRLTRINIFSLIILFVFAWYSLTLIVIFYGEDNSKLQVVKVRSSVEEKFSSISNPSGVKVFVIDPHRLFYSLTLEEKELLGKRNFTVKVKPKLTTFGIFDHDSSKLDKIESYFLNQGFRLFLIRDVDPKERRIQNLDLELEKKTITHRFYLLHDYVIHVVTFFLRSNYLWHGKVTTLPADVSHVIGDDLPFGRHEGAFERFEIVPFEDNGIDHFAPVNKVYFLFELATSRFVDCNFESTRNYITQYRNISVPDIQFGRQFVDAIQELKRIFHENLIPFWLINGTLLGWYRQCSLIPYITSVTLAVWIKDFDHALIDQLAKNLLLRQVYGSPKDSLQLELSIYNLRIDLFFIYEERNYFWYGSHLEQKRRSLKYEYPKFTLCSAELIYQKILVPCESELILTTEYGPNWQHPEVKWHLESSSINEKDEEQKTNKRDNSNSFLKLEH